MLRAVVVMATGALGSNGSVGVCYTRNMVVESVFNLSEARRKLRNVVLSASSLRGAVPVCLFTDLEEAQVKAVVESYNFSSRLFDLVVPDGLPGVVQHSLLFGETSNPLLRERRLKVRSRVGRIANLGRGPYDLTLFVDDDTFFCGDVSIALKDLHRRHRFDIRGKIFAKTSLEESAFSEAQRCVWRRADTQPFSASLNAKCLDRAGEFCSGAQGGAFAVRRGPKAERFANEWIRTYLDYYAALLDAASANRSSYAARSFGGDQAPLARLMDRNCRNATTNATDGGWTFGALPSAFNVRDAERPTRCATPIFGPLLLLHHKRYVSQGTVPDATRRLDALCAKINRPHEKGGSVWMGTRPNDSPKCAWMHHRARRQQGVLNSHRQSSHLLFPDASMPIFPPPLLHLRPIMLGRHRRRHRRRRSRRRR